MKLIFQITNLMFQHCLKCFLITSDSKILALCLNIMSTKYLLLLRKKKKPLTHGQGLSKVCR